MFRFNGFTQKANNAINLAIAQASALGHTYIGSEHILLGLLGEGSGTAHALLTSKGITLEEVTALLIKTVGRGVQSMLTPGDITPRCRRILENAVIEARQLQHDYVGTEHILLALLKEGDCYAVRFIRQLGGDTAALYSGLLAQMGEELGELAPPPQKGASRNPGRAGRGANKTPLLEKYGKDMTEWAAQDRYDPVIGRDQEIDRVIQILCRRSKNNPCLVGEAGVGKTAIIEGLAQRIAAGRVPPLLKDKRVYSLDLTGVVAGTKYRGDFEERVKGIIAEVTANGQILLFIDEIHHIMGVGAAEGAVDAANILKPQLARGELQLIGATTFEEYRKHIEKDSALERRFQSVKVGEPTPEQAVQILQGLRARYEAHHRLRISDGAIQAAVQLSSRYIHDRWLPDKAIDLLDEAASRRRLENLKKTPGQIACEQQLSDLQQQMEQAIAAGEYGRAAGLREQELAARRRAEGRSLPATGPEQVELTDQDIARVVASITGVEVSDLTCEEGERLQKLEERLSQSVLGQQEAVSSVARAVRRGRLGLKDPARPVGSFLFLGPTGVGKTELCRALSRELFGSEQAMIRLDMSEYMEKHTVSKLIGSPPGYVGYDEGGQLTERVRRKPYCLVLFDEVEKAHPEVFNLLLQILEDGQLTDAQGRQVSFRQTLVIMTSNIGARHMTQTQGFGFAGGGPQADDQRMRQAVMGELRQTFKPELLNRIDEIVVFHRLSQQDICGIAQQFLQKVSGRLAEKGIALSFGPEVVQEVARAGFDPAYGARPLRRVVQSKIEDLLADEMLAGHLESGDRVCCHWHQEGFFLEKAPLPQQAPAAL